MRDTADPPPESEADYDSDMAAYVGAGNPVVERNIAQMKKAAFPRASAKAKATDDR